MSKEINKQQDRLNDTAEKIVELLSLTALEDRGAILALVGKKMDVHAFKSGRLYLGINDDNTNDNEGLYRVRIREIK